MDAVSLQCGNFMVFLPLRFYVKSILRLPEVQKLPVFASLGALDFVDFLEFSLQKVQKIIRIKIESLQMC